MAIIMVFLLFVRREGCFLYRFDTSFLRLTGKKSAVDMSLVSAEDTEDPPSPLLYVMFMFSHKSQQKSVFASLSVCFCEELGKEMFILSLSPEFLS